MKDKQYIDIFEEKAIEYALQENNEKLFEDKANLLIKLEKYEDAAEVALRIKDKFEEIFNIAYSRVKNDSSSGNIW